MQGERHRHYRRFGLIGREINASINEPPENVDPYDWVEHAMRDLYNILRLEDDDDDDFIGVEIFSENLSKGSVWFSFRPISQFSVDDLWNIFLHVAQSCTEFNITDPITIVTSRVTPSRGAGRVPLTRADVRKQSILTIVDDNLCLPRALITSYFYEMRGQARTGILHERWNKIRAERGTFQKQLAEKVVNHLRLRIPRNGCGLNEIYEFQLYFARKGVAIVVYNFRELGTGARPLYDGTDLTIQMFGNVKYTLRILFYENRRHYRPILNINAAAGSRNFCIPCNISYTTERNHSCKNRCLKCLQNTLCDSNERLIHCIKCSRDFFGNNCFQNHLKKKSYSRYLTVCQGVYVCETCLRTVRIINRKINHRCGMIYCKICKKYCMINHLCFVQVEPESLERSKIVYLFYDFETRCESPLHVGDDNITVHEPNLCVVHQVCSYCLEDDNIQNWCTECGVREYVFTRNPVSEFVELCLLEKKNFKKTICIAHNAQSFDSQFLLKHMVEKLRIKPSIILNGSKIVVMTVQNVKFIDSLNFMNLPLSSLPEAFSLLDIEKGTFPHLFNRTINENYVGPVPSIEEYCVESMRPKDREKFLEWYAQQQGKIFNFKEELLKYCKLDVKILRLACLAYRKIFLNIANICPFEECCTIAGTCLKVFRKKFLKTSSIGIIPKNGYRCADNQSREALKWLVWMENVLQQRIVFAARGREIRLDEGVLVDGFCANRDGGRPIVLNYHGCFYHGCVKCYRINRDKPISSKNDECMNDRYERTLRIQKKIIDSDKYELIEIWGCDFAREYKTNHELRLYVDVHPLLRIKPLNPRDAFYGGRTENFVKVYDIGQNEQIHYVDVTSLYPFINKTGRYPVGHPAIFVGEECKDVLGRNYEKINEFDGLISCKILPPRNLMHPLLPTKMHGKLLFLLCRKCAEDLVEDECAHENENDRCLNGTWVADEIKKAIELGYSLKTVYEIWSYEMTCYDPASKTGGLFGGYIDEFFKLKTEASGFPADCVDDVSRDRYISEFERVEGVKLEKDRVCVNSSLRSVAKLCLVSLWGKFGQQEDKSTTEVIDSPKRLHELLFSPRHEVLNILPVDQEVLYVRHRLCDEAPAARGQNVNVVIAAYTTALARLKLYSYLEPLRERALYVDTDSVLFVSKPNMYELETGPLLGDLTNELISYGENAYITSFVSGGPKFYAFTVRKPDGSECSVCKVKGIRMNFKNTQIINFESVRELIENNNDEEENGNEFLTVSETGINRTRFHDVITRKEKKTVRPIYTKRWFVDNKTSYPYGFKF